MYIHMFSVVICSHEPSDKTIRLEYISSGIRSKRPNPAVDDECSAIFQDIKKNQQVHKDIENHNNQQVHKDLEIRTIS